MCEKEGSEQRLEGGEGGSQVETRQREEQMPSPCGVFRNSLSPTEPTALSLFLSHIEHPDHHGSSLFVSASAQENDLWVQSRCPNSSVSVVVCGARPGVNDGAEWTGEADWESFTSSANPVPLPCG